MLLSTVHYTLLVASEVYELMQCLHAAMFGHQVSPDPLWAVGYEQVGTYRNPNLHPSPWV